jgi:CBS domain containing-hemolysin-like protein
MSAFFSGSETAFLGLDVFQIERVKTKKSFAARSVIKLINKPETFLGTIILGNLFINIGLTNYFATFLEFIFGRTIPHGQMDYYVIIILTPILVVFGEIMPKIMGVRFGPSYSLKASTPILIISKILFPIRWVISHVIDFLLGPLRLDDVGSSQRLTEEEVALAVRSAASQGLVSSEEGKRVISIIKSNQIHVSEEMMPVEKMMLVEKNTSINNVKKEFIQKKCDIAYVYTKNTTNIIGAVKLSKLIPFFFGVKKADKIGDLIIRIPNFLDSITLNQALENFISDNNEIALIIDEFGKIVGGITLKDVLSKLLINIEEDEPEEEALLEESSSRTFFVLGKLSLDDFNKTFNANLKSNYVETAGGYIVEKMGNFPGKNDVLQVNEEFIFSNFKVENYIVVSFSLTLMPSKYKNYKRMQEKLRNGD